MGLYLNPIDLKESDYQSKLEWLYKHGEEFKIDGESVSSETILHSDNICRNGDRILVCCFNYQTHAAMGVMMSIEDVKLVANAGIERRWFYLDRDIIVDNIDGGENNPYYRNIDR